MSSEEFKCIFCKETFDDKESLQVHFRKHGDLNFHLNKSRPQDDQTTLSTKPTSSKDQPEMVQCDVCPDMFTSISKAITHKHKVHPDHDAKYFCPWCGKLFTMKHLYNKHIQTTHPNEEIAETTFRCDICKVDFNKPGAIAYHNKFFHRVDDMPTIGNSKKLKMVGQEAIQVYYCPFCGEEYENKVNLHKHMTDDHSDENQNPDDVLRCPVCEAIFYHLDAYELHLTYHSIDDLYSERSQIMDEITDFSLETVPPLAEKVETLDPDVDSAMGIEQLFEVTMGMGDPRTKRKKHKKHKKSKKSAITLDQFLNMNTDVFGEGLDFQGVEEVPTQAIAKRLKKPIRKPVETKLPPDIEKLKRQGIVIKKKPGPPVKSLVVKSKLPSNQNPKTVTQLKPNTTKVNDVLNKLMNQNNSQIKIMKMTNAEVKNTNEQNNEIKPDSPVVVDMVPIENKEPNGTLSTMEQSPSVSEEKDQTKEINLSDDPKTGEDTYPNNITRKSPNLDNVNPNSNDDSNDSHLSADDNRILNTDQITKVPDKLVALRNNCNIVINSNKLNDSNVKITKESTLLNNANEDNTDCEEDTVDSDVNGESKKADSLNVIKHLSHLIVKPCNQEKKQKPDVPDTATDKKVAQPDISKIAHLIRNNPAKSATNLSKNITQVKTKHVESDGANITDDEFDKAADTDTEPCQSNNLANILNNPHLNIQTIKKSIKVEPIAQKETTTESSPKTEKASADLLKHLKNVTAKPVAVNKTVNISQSQKLVNTIKKEPCSIPIKHNKTMQEDIEIFNIDDSDSDEANSNNKQAIKLEKMDTPVLDKPMDVLKNINKNITIKSLNSNNSKKTDKLQAKEFDDDEWEEPQLNNSKKPNSPQITQKQSAINNVLKNLNKNITVKSGNSSPAYFPNQDCSRDSIAQDDGSESDTDPTPGRVKIMEVDNADEEAEHTDASDHVPQDNVKVQYPDSNSDDDDGNYQENSNQNFSEEDIEMHLATNTVKKNNNHALSNPKLDSLKNTCKDLVIKPSGRSINRLPQVSLNSDEIPLFAKSLSNQMSIKNLRQGDNSYKYVSNQSSNMGQSDGSSTNKPVNKKMVNKEVKTVKTFQTQTQTETVIQEITTTVTKTIKTVNQSSKQEVKCMPQSNMPSVPRFPQVIGNNSNFQSVKIRQATPTPGPRIRNPGMRPTRVAQPAAVRASNQLVPVRPRFNTPRQSNPRMPIRPSTSGPIRGPIRMAPGVTVNTAKRTNIEAPGHFSCFKKPKESLIPEADFSAMNKHEGDSPVQFSAMHMSKSNYACTTKTVKGNSVVTSTQVKSEMSASSQHLGKLRNLSGLSVVKTSQANQSHVEEKCEINAAKQNTLDAIQRLQSQGLLVKKPRSASDENEHSEPDGEDMQHLSDGEFDS